MKMFLVFLLLGCFFKALTQSAIDSIKLKISYSKKHVENTGINVINYSVLNNYSVPVVVLHNPMIGYKSDKVAEGYFEVEFKNKEAWNVYTKEISDYNYKSKGKKMFLASKAIKQGVFNLSMLYNFEKGVYRLRLILSNLKTNSLIISNWLYFSVN